MPLSLIRGPSGTLSRSVGQNIHWIRQGLCRWLTTGGCADAGGAGYDVISRRDPGMPPGTLRNCKVNANPRR